MPSDCKIRTTWEKFDWMNRAYPTMYVSTVNHLAEVFNAIKPWHMLAIFCHLQCSYEQMKFFRLCGIVECVNSTTSFFLELALNMLRTTVSLLQLSSWGSQILFLQTLAQVPLILKRFSFFYKVPTFGVLVCYDMAQKSEYSKWEAQSHLQLKAIQSIMFGSCLHWLVAFCSKGFRK